MDTGANDTALAIDSSTLATTGGVAVVDANGSTGAGTLTTTSLSGNTVLGGNGGDGGITFGNLNIANSGATGDYGLFIQDSGSGFNFGTTGGSIDSVGGTAVKIDPVTTDVTLS
ncbi:hypothetical protein [Breoghania sp.]|uniref:hypothetical protein n=1 Tax=Breoghania sp. TaxID=2065378 RepID=UPI0026159FFA|nr:hypothetical protein [Breoghania sp.]MDJ0929606.1 hypothetical protein [Breoghania sp.]